VKPTDRNPGDETVFHPANADVWRQANHIRLDADFAPAIRNPLLTTTAKCRFGSISIPHRGVANVPENRVFVQRNTRFLHTEQLQYYYA
jgi:hypothetical protein